MYDSETQRVVHIIDMPTWMLTVNKTLRPRLDVSELCRWIAFYAELGVQTIAIEEVAGRPKQSNAKGVTQGWCGGCLYTAAHIAKLPIELVPATVWKRVMRVPGKRGTDDSEQRAAIIARADEVFPHDREKWRGPRGGKLDGRAEAALLARFAYDWLVNETRVARQRFVKPGSKLLKAG